ncbi:MAG: hypothetical protein ACYCS7_10495 [Acidimicrobiales bacterium]
MADAVSRARRQLARRRWLRRWLPTAIVGCAVPLGAATATAWVWPRATSTVTAAPPVDRRVQAEVAHLAGDAAALSALHAALSSSETDIANLPNLPILSGQGSVPLTLAPLPSLPAVGSFSLPPSSHATTGASGAP